MARIRTVKPEFWVSEQIAECSPNARLTFIGMWNFCDDNGVHPAKPKTLKAELYPMDDCSAAEVAAWVAELVQVGLVVEFESGGSAFWHVTGWSRHQKIDRPSFKYPSPPGSISANPLRKLAEPSPKARRAPPPGEEGNGEEGNGEEEASSKPSADAEQHASEDAHASHAPAAGQGRTQGTRLPKDWTLPADWRTWAAKERSELDLAAVAESFADYWHAAPGAKGRKADWFAAWRYWVRNQRAQPAAAATAQPIRQACRDTDYNFADEVGR